ncbi:hypothetical protein ACMFMG_006857 [Clarireedia jacksonii]
MDPNIVLAELQETLRYIRGEITFLREQFAAVTTTIPLPADPTTSRPKPSLPYPDKFASNARTDSLSTYIAKFERLVGEARVRYYPDDVLIKSFRKGLPKATQARLIDRGPEPIELDNFIVYVQRLVNPTSTSPFILHSPVVVQTSTILYHYSGPFRRPSVANPPGDPIDVNVLEAVEED